jgi:hypothetical protein
VKRKKELLESEETMEKDMENRKVIDKRSIKLEHVLKSDYIPFLYGRPEREKVIGNDDLLNLEILLNTCKNTENFIECI